MKLEQLRQREVGGNAVSFWTFCLPLRLEFLQAPGKIQPARLGLSLLFKVKNDANKVQIKQAVEKIFGVKVLRVNTINVKPKYKRVGRYAGTTSRYKKAIVTLAEGSQIEL